MITPRWVAIRAQPIAISDVLQYLRAALDVPIHGIPFTRSAALISCLMAN